MAEKTLQDLLIHTMKDMYFAENAIYKALPKMIEGAKNEQLKQGLTQHREETKNQISRLEKMFASLGARPQSVTCKGIQGILGEGDEVLKEFGDGEAGDAGVISSCQAVEHYEITRYGCMHAWATELGLDEIADLVEETLSEEYAADEKLTALAEGGINQQADQGDGMGGMLRRSSGRGAGAPATKGRAGQTTSKSAAARSGRATRAKGAETASRTKRPAAKRTTAAKTTRGSTRKTSGRK
jgi:ferritin-like metal-binding protein YciE